MQRIAEIRWIGLLAGGFAALLTAFPADALEASRPGWQIDTEGPDRVYLSYAPSNNAPRSLLLACLKDESTFGFYADDLSEIAGPAAHATMQLRGGPATFTVPGEITPDPETGLVAFVAQMPVPPWAMPRLAQTLIPLMLSRQPIRITFGEKTRELPPIAGLPDPAHRFATLCFGPPKPERERPRTGRSGAVGASGG